MPTPDEQRVRTLIESWAHAISTEDRPAILAHHSADLLMFDFPPSIIRGLDGYDRTWDFFFESLADRSSSIRATSRSWPAMTSPSHPA